MNDQYNDFHHWQLLGHRRIEDDSKYYHCDNEQCAVPWLGVITAVVQSNEALDLNGVSESASFPQGTEVTERILPQSTCLAKCSTTHMHTTVQMEKNYAR